MRKLPITIAAVAVCAFAGNAFADSADDIMAKNKCSGCHTRIAARSRDIDATEFAQTLKRAPGS